METSPNYFFRKKEFPFTGIFEAESVLDMLKKKDEILDSLEIDINTEIPADTQISGDVVIMPGVKIKAGVVIEGPVYIGKNSVIGPHAFIRKGTIIGENCEIGRAEIKGSIIMNRTKAHHHCYIGDSVIGNDVNVGCGVVFANFKFEGSDVVVDNKNVGKKFGAIVGDDVSIGCNSVCAPGTLIGAGCWIYPLSSVRGFVAADSVFKTKIEHEIVEKKPV
ncbi:MAG: glucose-1-phosphate thymidylyltransferase [Candidatus Nanoarchaeia archaeon]|nr:glucose-1-phosphate thymidylyltransferase [Candidatus Nanoarchaeia archaeon]MDD5239418.1 glucose-1-phosphate thymidylyltransferase [Candidatus Nanoarchaeia archaeon]